MLDKIFLIFFILVSKIDCNHPTLYEISTRPWLYELSQKYGKEITKLRNIPLEEFDYLSNKGIEIIWMMGIWKLGNYGLEYDKKNDYSNVLPDWTKDDVIGSPYSIVEYTCNPEIGTNDDLIWLREQINKRNMKLMLDFVPNHSAVDAPTAITNQKLYIRAPDGTKDSKKYTESGIAYGKDPYFDPWMDVIQWNYWETDTRVFMKNNLLTVLKYADGARCDMAHLILNDVFGKTWEEELKAWNYQRPTTEFWEYAFEEVKSKYPNAILLAEVYDDWQIELLYQLGFTYTYDKALLDKLRGSPKDVKEYIQEKEWSHATHFVENHDENRIIANVDGNIEKAKVAGALACTLGGMAFFNHGQWNGYKNKLDVHLRRGASEPINTKVLGYYKRLTDIIKDPAFKSNNYFYIKDIKGDKADDFIAYIRNDESSYYLVVINYGESDGCVEVPIYNIEGSGEIKLREMIDEVEYYRNIDIIKEKGFTVCLDGYHAKIFKYNY
jgi:glycosidase